MPTPMATLAASTKLEIIQRQAVRQLRARLNKELDWHAMAWEQLDKQEAQEAGIAYTPVELEKFNQDAFHPGSRPSIMRLPFDHYPACAVMADTVRPDPESGFLDSRSVYRDGLFVEYVVRSDRFSKEDAIESLAMEGLIDKRVKRTGEAIISAIAREPTLGRAVEPITQTPSLTIYDPFQIQATEPDQSGRTLMFQMGRVDFTVKVYSAIPVFDEPVSDPLLAGVGA